MPEKSHAVAFRCKSVLVRLLLSFVFVLGATVPLAAQEEAVLWYETDDINPGLEPPLKEIDRGSPRVALRNFVELVQSGDLASAAHLLNLSQFPESEQTRVGMDTTAKLASIVDRKLRIDWSQVPVEPDARTAEIADGQSGLQPRRDYLVEEFNVQGQVYAIRLSRYAIVAQEGEAHQPVWLFSQDTVDNVNLLYDAFGPRRFEAQIPDRLKSRLGWLIVWEWIALPLLFLIVFLVGLITSKVIRMGRHISANRVLRRTFEHAALPLSLVTASAMAHWLLGFIVSLSGPATAVISPALVMLAVVGVSLAALRAIDALLDHVTRRYLRDTYDTPSSSEREFFTSMYALRRIVLVVTVGFSLVFVLMQFNIFADMGLTLLASAGLLTVILGIAGQVTLGNMVASLQIAIAKPIRIGDSIHYEGDWCVVEAIFFTFIRLRTWDERRVIVPVKYFLSYPFKNWSVLNERMLSTIRLVLDPMANVAVLRDKFATLAKAIPEVIEYDRLQTCVAGHSAQGLVVEFYVMTSNPFASWTVETRLREELVGFVANEHPDWWFRERFDSN